MSLSTLAEFWSLTKEYISDEDRKTIVHSLVDILIDHNYDLDDVLYEFEHDKEMSKAIKFAKDELEEESEDSEYEDGYEDDEDYN